MTMFLDVRCKDLIFLKRPRTSLQSHFFTTRSSYHVYGNNNIWKKNALLIYLGYSNVSLFLVVSQILILSLSSTSFPKT
jgi:hypothetical protein